VGDRRAGYEVVFKGFLLLLAGIPVYVWMRWRAARPGGTVPAAGEPAATPTAPDRQPVTV